MVTYCPNVGAGGECCWVLFRGLLEEVGLPDPLIHLGALCLTPMLD